MLLSIKYDYCYHTVQIFLFKPRKVLPCHKTSYQEPSYLVKESENLDKACNYVLHYCGIKSSFLFVQRE